MFNWWKRPHLIHSTEASFGYLIINTYFDDIGNPQRIQSSDEWSWLNHGRYLHSCETFPMNNQTAIVVAGTLDHRKKRCIKIVLKVEIYITLEFHCQLTFYVAYMFIFYI